MAADIWKDREVAKAFLDERSLTIPDRRRQLEVMLRVLGLGPAKPQRALDLGCGNAILLETLLETFPEATGVAVDFSPPMLDQARERLGRFGPRAALAEADLQNPSWRQALVGAFDIIVSGFAIHHLPDERKKTLYGEIYDLLTPGGVFLNAEHVASATPRIEILFDDAMADHLHEARRQKGENVALAEVRRAYVERPDRAANILARVEEQCAWLEEIGFRDVDCFWKYFELAIFGGVK
jgi:ubiquinone/menaquinone biosynthesis C-methylase UbiE